MMRVMLYEKHRASAFEEIVMLFTSRTSQAVAARKLTTCDQVRRIAALP